MKMRKQRTVLAVYDSLMVCEQIKTALKNEDLELHVAHSGQEALDRMEECCPDLILLDIILPDMEGYELFGKIKERDRNSAAIVFITSKDGEQDVIRGFSMGASDYIKKPFRMEEMKSRVLAHLDTKCQRDELALLNEELRANMEKLNTMVYRDELTGLYNRHYLSEKVAQDLAESDRQDALIMVDVDNFKRINDSYGHDAGDTVLVCLSSIMEGLCRRHKVARWGGEEFLIVLLGAGKEEALELAEQIRSEIADFPIVYNDVTFFCTVTMGLCAYRRDLSFKQNVECADHALYCGKKSGKNCTVWNSDCEG